MLSPPRPQKPRLWRVLKLILRPLDYLDEYGQLYGDCFAVGNENTPFVYVNSPEAVQAIFAAEKTHLTGMSQGGFLNQLLGDNSLLLLQGDRHQQQKKVLTPPFAREKIRGYASLITEITNQVTKDWETNQTFYVRPVMQEITLRVILAAIFGLQQGDRYTRLRLIFTELLESFSSPWYGLVIFFPWLRKDWGNWSPWGRFLKLKADVTELLTQEIQQRRQQENLTGDDILTILLLTKYEDGENLSEQEIQDQLMTLLVAGHETTASALTWALYWIHRRPQVLAKLRSHIEELGSNPSLEAVLKLPYLEAICSETLRIYPITPTALPRIVKVPFDLMGYHFEPGTILNPCIYLIHRREDIYPKPEEFIPERFLTRQFSPYEYLPFGGGSRRCLGTSLALLEMKLVLYSLITRFEFKLTSSRAVKPVRRGLTVAPEASFKMRVKKT